MQGKPGFQAIAEIRSNNKCIKVIQKQIDHEIAILVIGVMGFAFNSQPVTRNPLTLM
ncbi:hypothetical protein SBDP1_130034 [Syntrophobacter sp. SbD1]|nr:hypothetical protein SBDP1_130034 [Syntrophobacter sp. SbD1]